jgi:DNA-binding MarR family transcriptional regulator
MGDSTRKSAAGDGATAVQKGRWKAAMQWRRAVEGALAGTGLTFTQWLLLDALGELTAETNDAAIQSEVAARVGLDQGTVSLVMGTLADKALVDRAPDITGRAWRTYLTKRAQQILRDTAAEIESRSAWGVSRAWGRANP